jgi:hypothetical protein
VHLTDTPIWCDARRRRDVCFVSAADRVGRAGHGQLIGTPITMALVGSRDDGHLAVPVMRPFTLGTLRLELIPSGRGLGAAALHVDLGGRSVLYAGALRARSAEVRAADAVVVAAPFGEPHHRFAALDDVAAQVVAWVRAQLAAGRTPVLVVENVLDGLELAEHLAAAELAVAGARALREAALALGSLVTLPPIRAPGREPTATIRIETERTSRGSRPGEARAPRPEALALVAARAIDPQPAWPTAFAWPCCAGRAELLAWIEHTRAREVFVTGACAESIATALGERGRVLGPPRQMALFGP